MPDLLDIALAHQRRRLIAADGATARVLKLWRKVPPQELDYGWRLVEGQLVSTVAAAQLLAASQATPYTNAVAPGEERLVPEAFTNVTLDGRELAPALYGAVTTTKKLTPVYGASRAFEVAAAFLATVARSAILDMGRTADGVLAAGRGYTNYVRVLSPGACSRCAVLAGKSSYRVAFKRHPSCRCTAMPIKDGKTPGGFFDDSESYFDSLSKAEQDRVFTKAGAEAIRNGADVNKVVNARRGAYGIGYSGHYNVPVRTGTRNTLQPTTIGVRADGSPLQVYATTEGTTSRGDFSPGRRTTSIRLMPESIAVMAGGNPVRWRELLFRYGYLQ